MIRSNFRILVILCVVAVSVYSVPIIAKENIETTTKGNVKKVGKEENIKATEKITEKGSNKIIKRSNEGKNRTKDKSFFFLQTSSMTYHWNQNPDRNNDQGLLGLEYHSSSKKRLYGVAHFQNSYFQPTWYLYTGRSYDFKEISNFKLYGKVTYGIISGYDDENGKYSAYMNRLGTFPAVLPSFGMEYKDYALEVSLFGIAGYIVNFGVKF